MSCVIRRRALSAHTGGNRLKNPQSAHNFSINEKTDEQVREAESLIGAGKPRQLMLILAWWWVISARTFLERLTNAPDLVENARQIKCPVLFIRGDQEPMENYPASDSKKIAQGHARSRSFPTAITFTLGGRCSIEDRDGLAKEDVGLTAANESSSGTVLNLRKTSDCTLLHPLPLGED